MSDRPGTRRTLIGVPVPPRGIPLAEQVSANGSAPERGDLLAVVLAKFLSGEERGAELAARLAFESGYTLSEVYDTLRLGMSDTSGPVNGIDRMREDQLDGQLARFAARLSPLVIREREPQAMVLSNGRRGITAAICHMLAGQGVTAISTEFDSIVNAWSWPSQVSQQLPSLRCVIVDSLNASPAGLSRQVAALQQTDLSSAGLSAVVLTTQRVLTQSSSLNSMDEHLTIVTELPALLAMAGAAYENPLTLRERDVLRRLSEGSTHQQIASGLAVTTTAVKTYVESARIKLKSLDRSAAVVTAVRRGLL